jgi:uncharacterized damage-inducible protein DinB
MADTTGKGLKPHFEMLAAYNRWANGLIVGAAEPLDWEVYSFSPLKELPSLAQLLQDMLARDRLWLHRFTGQGEASPRLDKTAPMHVTALRIAREAEDERIVRWLADMPPEDFSGRFSFINFADMRTISRRLAPALAHFFNEQAHGRGVAVALLALAGTAAPEIDMATFHRSDHGRSHS